MMLRWKTEDVSTRTSRTRSAVVTMSSPPTRRPHHPAADRSHAQHGLRERRRRYEGSHPAPMGTSARMGAVSDDVPSRADGHVGEDRRVAHGVPADARRRVSRLRLGLLGAWLGAAGDEDGCGQEDRQRSANQGCGHVSLTPSGVVDGGPVWPGCSCRPCRSCGGPIAVRSRSAPCSPESHVRSAGSPPGLVGARARNVVESPTAPRASPRPWWNATGPPRRVRGADRWNDDRRRPDGRMAPVVLASTQGVGGVPPVEFRVLGGLEVVGSEGPIELRGDKRRVWLDCCWPNGAARWPPTGWYGTCGTTTARPGPSEECHPRAAQAVRRRRRPVGHRPWRLLAASSMPANWTRRCLRRRWQ